jgi:GNAT superfamily N-acetyltransferase
MASPPSSSEKPTRPDRRPLATAPRRPRRGARQRPPAGAIEVRSYEDRDEERVLELLQAAFGRWPRGIDGVGVREFFRWKHMDGPHGRSMLLVAESAGALVGFHGYLPWRLTAGGRPLVAMRGVDLAVDPFHRRRGASVALRAAADFPAEVELVWSNPNPSSRTGSLSSGRRPTRALPRFLRARAPLLGAIGRTRSRSTTRTERAAAEAATAAETLAPSTPASLLPTRAGARDGRLRTVKDVDYLRWRYGRFADYRAVHTSAGEGGGGLAIFRCRRHGPLSIAHVCELLVERGDLRTARELLRDVGLASRADIVNCNFDSRREAARCGFVEYRRAEGLMTLAVSARPAAASVGAGGGAWALSQGDLELL